MGRIRIVILTFVVALCSLSAWSNVIVELKSDSLNLLIGDQTRLHLEVTADRDSRIDLPIYSDTIIDGLEILPPIVTDTQYINRGNRIVLRRDYIVTSFDTSIYYIPSMVVYVDSIPYESNGVSLSFLAFELESDEADAFFGPKPIMNLPIKWIDVKYSVYELLLLVILVLLLIFIIRRYKDNKPILKTIRIEPKQPAHIKALESIERLKNEKSTYINDIKGYYTHLTDIIRQYINERYGINATEMTTSEIYSELLNYHDKSAIKDLSDLLQIADLVKFAKFNPLLNENDQNLLNAIDFIEATKLQTDVQIEPSDETVVVEERRSRGARIALICTIAITALATLSVAVLLIRSIYYLYF